MITLASIDDSGYIKIPYSDITEFALKEKCNEAEAFKRMLKLYHGPIFGSDYIYDVYEINVKKGMTGIRVTWKLRV